MPVTVYSRPEHGSIPIYIHKPGDYEVPNLPFVKQFRPDIAPVHYPSGNSLLAALTRIPKHGLTLRRYFHFNPLKYQMPLGVMEDMFFEQPPKIATSIGIDVGVKAKEIRKIFYAGFGSRLSKHGYDPEDVLQEVYRGILVRNKGTCPFNPAKSSFSHYVHMVSECIINNYHRKEHRRTSQEQLGFYNKSSESEDVAIGAEDYSSEGSLPAEGGNGGMLIRALQKIPTLDGLTEEERRTYSLIIPHLLKGTDRKEIAQHTKISLTNVNRAIRALKEQVVVMTE